jgi:alkylhydroperoxidase/carboxymuconolactone decarboxylase family protein YurZ
MVRSFLDLTPDTIPVRPSGEPIMQQSIGSRDAAPDTFKAFTDKYGEIAGLWENLAQAVDKTGPLDAKARELVKLGIAVGQFHETAARSHIRRATAAGAARAELEQVVLLSATM